MDLYRLSCYLSINNNLIYARENSELRDGERERRVPLRTCPLRTLVVLA